MNRRQWTVTPYDRDLVQPRCWLLVGEQERVPTTIISQDDTGAEFAANRKIKIGKLVRAYGRYERDQDFVVGRADPRGIVGLHHPSRGCASFHAADRRLSAHVAGARPDDEAAPEEALLRHQLHTLHLGDGTAGVDGKDLGTPVTFQSCWPHTRVLAGPPGGPPSLRNRVG